jgi:predicted nucleic acid-binding protein
MYLIDTNIFLEMLLNQQKKEMARTIFTKLEKGEIDAVISGFSLHSIEFILSIKKKNDVLREFLQALNDFPNISLYHTSIEEDLDIVGIMEQTNLDFDDANQYYVAKKFNAEILTFDKDFRGIKGINVHVFR